MDASQQFFDEELLIGKDILSKEHAHPLLSLDIEEGGQFAHQQAGTLHWLFTHVLAGTPDRIERTLIQRQDAGREGSQVPVLHLSRPRQHCLTDPREQVVQGVQLGVQQAFAHRVTRQIQDRQMADPGPGNQAPKTGKAGGPLQHCLQHRQPEMIMRQGGWTSPSTRDCRGRSTHRSRRQHVEQKGNDLIGRTLGHLLLRRCDRMFHGGPSFSEKFMYEKIVLLFSPPRKRFRHFVLPFSLVSYLVSTHALASALVLQRKKTTPTHVDLLSSQ